MFPYTIRPIKTTEFSNVRDAISQNYFLAKHAWTKPLSEMAYDGLEHGKWIGFGCFSESEELMSYCDCKEHEDGEIEIGICFTMEAYRGCGLAKLMLHYLITGYPNQEITIGTAESNVGMIACIKKMGFQEEYRVSDDRINGKSSIHYRHFPACHEKT